MTEGAANGWRQTRVTIGLLVAIVVATASVITGMLFVGGEADTKIGKAITAHDGCAHSHSDIRMRCAKSQERSTRAYRAVRVELRAVREALTEQRAKMNLVLDGRGRRTR